MKQYSPMAVALDESGKPISLHTYDSCSSIDTARNQFKVWQDHYHYKLLCTWIVGDDETDIVEVRCHVNVLGQVTRI